MKTRNNIYPKLEESPYTAPLLYGAYKEMVIFSFSSKMYLTKFTQRLEKHRKTINESLSNRFRFCIRLDLLADIVLYCAIEKRGFHITTESGDIKCQNSLLLNGVQQIAQKLPDCEKTTTPV